MDIGSLSMGLSQASVANSVQISVMKMAMNNSEDVDVEMEQMMNNMATDENLGRNIDVTV
ncbi:MULTISPECIES: YjfB family protein [unclassified Clostridium]|uniref:YjfB family protein n=1 Tax=unclassified Clostridium TaxID=2614128 RepID=UPI0002978244|nr:MULTISPECIES: YjfB family protein [unclassified Clostridium]EKQ51096.1 MAG: hypothetical protein A370_05123 [Clostridium sp. Maddingley MBC34-26]